MKAWLAEHLAGLLLSAFLGALRLARRKGYAWFLGIADELREQARARWWNYKLKTILTQQDPDDDLLADGFAKLWKFETPPEGSHWRLERKADGSLRYVPETGSGYIRNGRGEYLPAK